MTAGRKTAGYALDGTLAGFVFGFAQMLVCSLAGRSALLPFELLASVVIGRGVIAAPSAQGVVFGMLLFAMLSALLGVLYHRQASALSDALTRSGRLRPSAAGAAFGLLVWLPAALLARAVYPWFSDGGHLYDAWLCVAFFGVPLGLLGARTDSRQPVELKIVYSAGGPEAQPDRSRRRSPSSSAATWSPAATSSARPRKRPSLQKRPPLRLLVKTPTSDPSGNRQS